MFLQLILAAAIAAASSFGTWWLMTDHYEGVIAKAKIAQQVEIDKANTRADNAAIDWQAWAEAQPAKIVLRDRKAADAFKAAPEWSATPIPDSVLRELAAPAADQDPGVVAGPVPAASAPGARDEPRPGAGLSGAWRFLGRVRAPAQQSGEGSQP